MPTRDGLAAGADDLREHARRKRDHVERAREAALSTVTWYMPATSHVNAFDDTEALDPAGFLLRVVVRVPIVPT
jgi:hypothetical protein